MRENLDTWWIGTYDNEDKIPKWWRQFVERIIKEENEVAFKIIEELNAIEKKETKENVAKVAELIEGAKEELDDNTYQKLQRKLRVAQNRVQRRINPNFGALILHLRKKEGYSLQELGDMTGISPSYIHRMEKGERKAPSFKVIEKLADALKVEKSVLLEVANLEEESDEVMSLDELLYTHNFTVSGKTISKKQKQLFVKILTKIADCEWSPQTKHLDSLEIVDLINEFKELAN